MLNDKALEIDRDQNAPADKSAVLAMIERRPGISCYELYVGLNVGDINLYLALHELVEAGAIVGPDPYDDDTSFSMGDWHYSTAWEITDEEMAYYDALIGDNESRLHGALYPTA